jgi:hypothetical protein
METKPETVIISPHFDDAEIGNWEIITNPLIKPIIIYMQNDEERKKEALELKNMLDNIQVQLFQKSIPQIFLDPKNTLYFPDHINEFHPDHRKWGAYGEELFRQGLNVIFYSINMTSPCIHEVKEPDKKKEFLDKLYPSQKDMWSYDTKYYLFEGRYKFLM